jgi:hypothetical protein
MLNLKSLHLVQFSILEIMNFALIDLNKSHTALFDDFEMKYEYNAYIVNLVFCHHTNSLCQIGSGHIESGRIEKGAIRIGSENR